MTLKGKIMSARLLVFGFCLVTLAGLRSGTADELLNRIPNTANAIMVIDVEATLASPLAKKQGWQAKFSQEIANRPLMLPSEASRVVVASELDFGSAFTPRWELAMMKTPQPLAARDIARAEGGYAETIEGRPAVWAPSDAYFVSLEAQVLGAVHPADRQWVARWVRSVNLERTSPVISYFLQQSAEKAGKTSPIVLAIDLKDALVPHRFRSSLEQSSILRGKAVEKTGGIVALFEGIQGALLTVDLGDKARGTLRVVFSAPPYLLTPHAKDLLAAVMTELEMSIADMNSWQVTSEGNAIVFTGDFSTPGLRRVFSLLEIPSTKFSSLKNESPGYDDAKKMAGASQAYFSAVSTLIDDLQTEFNKERRTQATWAERYARKIDLLPILNVDEDLLVWGGRVAETLRGMGLDIRGAKIAGGVRKSQSYGYGAYQYNYDNNGYYSARTSSAVSSEIDATSRAQASKARFTSWKEIEDSRAAIRKTMTQKYEREF